MQKENMCPAGTARVDKEIFFSFFCFCFFGRNLAVLELVLLIFVFFLAKKSPTLLSGSQEIAAIKLSSSSPMCTGT